MGASTSSSPGKTPSLEKRRPQTNFGSSSTPSCIILERSSTILELIPQLREKASLLFQRSFRKQHGCLTIWRSLGRTCLQVSGHTIFHLRIFHFWPHCNYLNLSTVSSKKLMLPRWVQRFYARFRTSWEFSLKIRKDLLNHRQFLRSRHQWVQSLSIKNTTEESPMQTKVSSSRK